MTKDDIELLYEYDRWANDRVLQASSALSAEQFTRDLGGSFPSVRDTLLHIVAGEWGWLQYWKEPSPDAAFLANLTARRKVLFDPNAYTEVTAVQQKWTEVKREQVDFLRLLTNEGLERPLDVRGAQIKLVHLMHHVANHSTYHRGQISFDDASARRGARGDRFSCFHDENAITH